MQPGIEWSAVRAQFPALEQWTYLNTATLGLMPLRVEAAVAHHFARRNSLAHTDFLSWWDEIDELRGLIAALLHGPVADDVAFFPNACSALALARSAVQWKPGDEIVTLHDEFPNLSFVNVPLSGVHLVESDFDKIERAITERTRMVIVSSVNYQNGFRADWSSLAPRLRERGIIFYVDGTQSFGALKTCIQPDRAPDMFAVDCYKWACAPPGAAFAYIHPEFRKRLNPAVIGWRSDAGWRDFANLAHHDPVFATSAEKYEGGMLAFPSLSGLRASLEFMREIGVDAIERRVLDLAKAAGGDGTSSVVTLDLGDHDPLVTAAALKQERILVSTRKGKLRISAHFYNNEADVERLCGALNHLNSA